MTFPRPARTTSLVVVALMAGVLVSDVAWIPGCGASCKAATATAAAPVVAQAFPEPPLLGVSPFDAAEDVNPLAPVDATVVDGKIISASLVDDWGNVVNGEVAADGSSWRPTERLNFARNYTLKVNSTGNSGVPLSRTSTFSTLVPNNYAHPYLEVQGGFAIQEEQSYGIGTVIAAHFDEPIADKALAEKNMIVRTEPPVQGSWSWVSDTVARWRPERYYAPGTRVSVNVNTFGLKLGEGLYGQADAKASFTIGDAHVAIANDITKQVSVFDNGQLVRTMPTSMGRGGTETVNGRTIHFWTQSGTYTVLDKANPVIMDSSTYGLPVNSRLGYRQSINYATRISNDGIYLHELTDTIAQQGNTNMSAGCLNLNPDNARWFYDFSVPGDIVEVRNTGGPPLELWQNGDWSVPWEQWLAGSALR